jgi:hypothetical protein
VGAVVLFGFAIYQALVANVGVTALYVLWAIAGVSAAIAWAALAGVKDELMGALIVSLGGLILLFAVLYGATTGSIVLICVAVLGAIMGLVRTRIVRGYSG